jgi:Carboxypeptidase regulatory-like domain
LCADLVGKVLNSRGEAVSGVTVSVVNAAAVDAGKGISDANGAYAISNLTPGAYKLGIVPGQWVMSYIPDKGLTVNWGLAPHSPPVAVATLGTAAESSGTAPSKISHEESRPDTAGSGGAKGTSD